MPDLDAEAIAEAALKPAAGTQDGRSATAHPLLDQIEAAKFVATNTNAAARTWAGIPKHRAIPPGPQQ